MRPTRQHKYQLWHHNYLIVALLQNVLSPLCVTHQAPYPDLYLTSWSWEHEQRSYGGCTSGLKVSSKPVWSGIKDFWGWQFLTMKAAETLCIVCLPPEEHISWKNIWVTDLPKKSHFVRVWPSNLHFYGYPKKGTMNFFQRSSLGSTPSAQLIWLKNIAWSTQKLNY